MGFRVSFKNARPSTAPTKIEPPTIIGIPIDAEIPFEKRKNEMISAKPTIIPAKIANKIPFCEITKGLPVIFNTIRITPPHESRKYLQNYCSDNLIDVA